MPEAEMIMPETYDNTTISTYQTCPRKFQRFILQGYRPKVEARSLSYGAALHEGLAVWYAHKNTPPDEIRKLMLEQTILTLLQNNNITLADPEKIPEANLRKEFAVRIALAHLPPLDDLHIDDRRHHALLAATLFAYFEHYKYEPFEVIYVEKNFVILLPDGSPYSGILDLVIKTLPDNKIKPMEHKTTSSLYRFDEQFNPNSQVTGYMLGLRQILGDEASLETIINAILVPKRKDLVIKETDFQRFPNIYRTDEMIEEFQADVIKTIEEIKHDFQTGYFRKNTNACHQYGGCPFRPVCSRNVGAEQELVLSSSYRVERWTPLHQNRGRQESGFRGDDDVSGV